MAGVPDLDAERREQVNTETRQRLKAATHYTVGKLCEDLASEWEDETSYRFSPQFVAALAETTFRQAQVVALDLESFSKHAKRTIINADDVEMCARRNDSLRRHIESMAQRIEDRTGTKKSKKKKKN
ncbi:centromere protein S-like [Oscarella lobularis]|uniref:centromere protein S-like n=1 Tax=Oscarella lobularis TaxID=121494 RepID=UPI003313E694